MPQGMGVLLVGSAPRVTTALAVLERIARDRGIAEFMILGAAVLHESLGDGPVEQALRAEIERRGYGPLRSPRTVGDDDFSRQDVLVALDAGTAEALRARRARVGDGRTGFYRGAVADAIRPFSSFELYQPPPADIPIQADRLVIACWRLADWLSYLLSESS